jgi:secreted trypsin-like serine protease
LQYIQIGIVSGGVATNCGDQDYPGIYIRLDNPEVLDFVRQVESQEKLEGSFLV